MTGTQQPYIISIGDIAADILVDVPALPISSGELVLAKRMGFEPGGSANFLIAATRLGMHTKALGVLGADFWGDQLAAILTAEGVDLSEIIRAGTTTQAVVLVGEENQNAFVGMFGEGEQLPTDDRFDNLLLNSAGVYLTGYTLNETRINKMAFALLSLAKQAGVPVFLDTGPSFSRLPEATQTLALQHADVLLTTVDELPMKQLASLFSLGISQIVLKTGVEGCVLHTEDDHIEIAGHSVPVVDVTAAGDSFDAGYVVATVRGMSPLSAAKYANAVGAAKVQKFGSGRNVPTLQEVEQVLRQFSVDLE